MNFIQVERCSSAGRKSPWRRFVAAYGRNAEVGVRRRAEKGRASGVGMLVGNRTDRDRLNYYVYSPPPHGLNQLALGRLQLARE